MSFDKNTTAQSSPGFSLVEILVSITILVALMTMLFTFFNQATSAWQSTEKKMSAFREARAAFFYLKRDLSNMVASSTVKWSFHEDTSTLFNEPDLPPQANGDAIVFLTSTPAEGQNENENKSDLCLVGYYLAYRQTSASQPNKSYNLYRYFLSSDPTWAAPGSAATPTSGLLAFIQSGSTNLSTLVYSPPGINDGVLAQNVINFDIQAYDQNLQPLTGLTTLNTVKPDVVEISMTLFNQETAQRFSTPADWYYDEATSTTLQAANARTFHLRVPVK
ncbi:MAG: prepilin-type N-terminal cleavage/methylation domain-containing protein [Verrucomicrobiota bacterium]